MTFSESDLPSFQLFQWIFLKRTLCSTSICIVTTCSNVLQRAANYYLLSDGHTNHWIMCAVSQFHH